MKNVFMFLFRSAIILVGILAVLAYIAFWMQFPKNSGWGIIIAFALIGGLVWTVESKV